MAAIIIIGAALVAALLWFLGAVEARRTLRGAAFYLVIADLALIGLVIGNYVAGGKP